MKKTLLLGSAFVVFIVVYFYFPLPNHKDYSLYGYQKIQGNYFGIKTSVRSESLKNSLTLTDKEIVIIIDAWSKSDFSSDEIARQNDQVVNLGLGRSKIVLEEMGKILKANANNSLLTPKAIETINGIIKYIQDYRQQVKY